MRYTCFLFSFLCGYFENLHTCARRNNTPIHTHRRRTNYTFTRAQKYTTTSAIPNAVKKRSLYINLQSLEYKEEEKK